LTITNDSSPIRDISLDDNEDKGHPILFDNQEIRQMLSLARVGPSDVFYDLGSGWGQNLIIAITEFMLKEQLGSRKIGNGIMFAWKDCKIGVSHPAEEPPHYRTLTGCLQAVRRGLT